MRMMAKQPWGSDGSDPGSRDPDGAIGRRRRRGSGEGRPAHRSGRPDLSGTYDVATLTPLVRPREFGDHLFLTRERALEVAERERALQERGNQASNPNRAAPAEGGAAQVGFDDGERETFGAGNAGGHNRFWIDRGSEAFSIDGMYRTSIITEPKDGQYPPLTPERPAARVRVG
jgi:hypothetical protein